jgi:antitoxin (DNA-binding transcriptional repressor) of toxin-antitoxin stability system
MATVTIHVAKARRARLIERAAAGEEIVILRGKTPVARLTSKPGKRRFGAYRGEFEVPDSFFDPLPKAELDAFEGKGGGASGRSRRKR